MFGPYPHDYSEIADKFRKTGCYKYLTSPVLAASRCGPCFSSQADYYELPQTPIPQLRSPHCQLNKHKCKCKNVCDEIRYNLWLASTKSSIYIPDTATKWFEGQQQMTALYKRLTEYTPQQVRRWTKNPHTGPGYLDLKPPLRLMNYTRDEENVKYMSPEFADLVKRHNETMYRLHVMANLPSEYTPRILNSRRQRLLSGTEEGEEKSIDPPTLGQTQFYTNQDENKNCRNSRHMASDEGSRYSKARKKITSPQELAEEKKNFRKRKRKSFSPTSRNKKPKILQEIWKKPNAIEMRESVASFRSNKQESRLISSKFSKIKSKIETKNPMLPPILEEPENKKVIKKTPPPIPPKPKNKYILGKQENYFVGEVLKMIPNLIESVTKEPSESYICLPNIPLKSSKSETVQKNSKVCQILPKSSSIPTSSALSVKASIICGQSSSEKSQKHVNLAYLKKKSLTCPTQIL